MPNEFEKQVQQKMEELRLVPSEPVWQNVEMQIRKKKDRRRLIFWIPFLALLLGGGLWIGVDHYSNHIAYNKINKTQGQTNREIEKQNPVITSTEIADKKNEGNPKEDNKKISINEPGKQNDIVLNKEKSTTTDFSNGPAIQKQSSQKLKKAKENLVADTKKTSEKKNETFFSEINASNESIQQPEQKTEIVDSMVATNQSTDTSNIISANKEKNEINISKTDSLNIDSTSIKKTDTQKHAASKWKLNLVAASGLSGLGRLNLSYGANALAAYPVYNSPGSSMGGSVYYGPSPVQKNVSFSVGAMIKKQLDKQTFFSAGLQYNYYSNSIRVGTIVNQSRTIMDFSVAQYYSNNSSVTQPYHNQYHFVSLPASIDWQVLKKHPLNFSTGLSLQYLLKTNGLRFDYNSQSYFHNIKAFNRTQLFSEFGLTYSVSINKKPLSFGPMLQYGLTRLEKGNSANHLVSYGLKAQWQLNKK